MAATITKLTSKTERLRRDQAEELRSALQVIEAQMELPLDIMRGFYEHIEKRTASKSRWTFVMLSPEQNAVVVDYLSEHSSRPITALLIWALCFKHLRTDTGEILLRRNEIVDKIGQSAENVSRVMTELEICGAIIRRREKQGGMKGRGFGSGKQSGCAGSLLGFSTRAISASHTAERVE